MIDLKGGNKDLRPLYRVSATPETVDAAVIENGLVKITSAGTIVQPGDIVRFESDFTEHRVLSVDGDDFIIASTDIPAGTYYVMRPTSNRVNDDGSIIASFTAGPIQYVLDGVDTEVEEDTGTPANSRPLPVKIMNPDGTSADIISELQDINTELDDIEAKVSTEAKQDDIITELTALNAVDFATETTLQSLDGKFGSLGQKAMAGSAPVVIASDQSTLPISAASLPLPTGAATEAKQDDIITAIGDVSAQLPATLGTKTAAASLAVVLASDQPALPASQIPIATGSFAQITNLVATAQTFTAPAGAVGFKIQSPSTNSENIAFSIGAVATITAGILMEPGRSEDFDTGSNISVIATSAEAQTVTVIWRIRP